MSKKQESKNKVELVDIFEGSIVSLWRSLEDKTICLRVGPMTLTIENRDEKRVFREIIKALDKYQSDPKIGGYEN
jgi:hypothetical protein